MNHMLCEYLAPTATNAQVEITEDLDSNGKSAGKSLKMRGIFVQADVVNQNGRVYPLSEIAKAVTAVNKQLKEGYSICGECDHPSDLKINLDRVSHVITDMWMEGSNGMGTLKLIPTPMGNIIKTMIESGVKLGVSSRGSGEVDDRTGRVSGFELITVDVVATPSAQQAYPTPIYEGLLNMKYGHRVIENARDVGADARVQKYLTEQITRFIKELRLK